MALKTIRISVPKGRLQVAPDFNLGDWLNEQHKSRKGVDLFTWFAVSDLGPYEFGKYKIIM
tara:strand:+ start:175 stop:357 length:183 start_codon:yes stop_codon:yes gene_type:complete